MFPNHPRGGLSIERRLSQVAARNHVFQKELDTDRGETPAEKRRVDPARKAPRVLEANIILILAILLAQV